MEITIKDSDLMDWAEALCNREELGNVYEYAIERIAFKDGVQALRAEIIRRANDN